MNFEKLSPELYKIFILYNYQLNFSPLLFCIGTYQIVLFPSAVIRLNIFL